MRQGLFFAFILFVICSCTKPKVEIPAGVLHKEQMIPVLADVHIAQAAAAMYQTSDSNRYSLQELMTNIYKIHHTTESQYDSSVAFYSKHPEIMEAIYDSVITVLSRKQGEVEGIPEDQTNNRRR